MTENLPRELVSTAAERLTLPSGQDVEVPICRPVFDSWKGPAINTYGGKAILDYDGEPLYAELVILRIFEKKGWEGIWVDSYSKKYRTGIVDDNFAIVHPDTLVNKPPFLRFPNAFAKFGGCWDLVSWKGDRIIFCESKKSREDSIRTSQLRWLEERLSEGAKIENFLLVEWSEARTGEQCNVRELDNRLADE